MSGRSISSSSSINKVFYATSYHPIQAGSIDGTDVAPHDNGIRRALLASEAGLYDPHGDLKAIGDPYCTVFVGRLSQNTTEETLREAMSQYGRIKNLRLVRHIVTGASRRYAFVEYETEKEMRHAYEMGHNSIIDDCKIIVDYNRQQLMPGWIPRRLGGGLGGRKESGQLRFGGRDRPFRAPLRPIPHDDLEKLGIPLPPEGRYMSRSQIPPAPRRKRSSVDEEESFEETGSVESEDYKLRHSPADREKLYHKKSSVERGKQRSSDIEERYHRSSSEDSMEQSKRRNRSDRKNHSHKERSRDKDDQYDNKRNSYDEEEHSRKRHRHHHSNR